MQRFFAMIKEAKSRPIGLTQDIAERINPFALQTVKNYGKCAVIWFGPRPVVTIMNPNLLKEIFNKFEEYQRPVLNPAQELISGGLSALEGKKWAKHRKIIKPSFHAEKLKLMVPKIHQSCDEMIKKWEELVSGDGSLELDVWPDLHDLASDAIARAAFGTSYEQGKRVFHLERELADLVIHTILSTYIPGWRFLPTKNNRRMKELDKQITASLKDMVSRREKEMKSGEATNADLLSTLIESNWNEVREQGDDINARMSINDVIEECRAFHLAGQEATSCLMVWMMIVLAMHPNWQARAREEVLQIFGSSKPHFKGLSQLKVVTMIIYEVLRCYPPVEGTYRIVHRDTKLGDYLLPAGVLLYLPILFVHRDKELWGEDASEFNPERFANGVSNAAKDQHSFFPFAWGPRTCIGLNYALLQTKLALAMILQSFSFELSASYIHAPYSLLTIRPQHGAHLVFQKLG